MRKAVAVLWFGALVSTAAPFAGQQGKASPPQAVFRSSVDLVHCDASVLDKDRHPVRGLTAADFTVLEDGKPQPIVAFSAVDVPPPPPPTPATWMREVSPDVHTNEPEQSPDGRLFVLLLDDALLPPDLWAVRSAKGIAKGVVDRLSASDQVAVVFSGASGNGQDFTTDRTKLLAAIDTLQAGSASHLLGWDTVAPRTPQGGASVPAMDGDSGLRLNSLKTLQFVADTLIAASQRRKALIFVSPGITVDAASDAQVVEAKQEGPGLQIREANHELASAMPEIFRRMERANVTVYPIDPFGLGGIEAYILQAAQGLPSLRNAPPPAPFYNWLAPTGPPRPTDLAHHAATIDMDFLMAAAANTGGHAIVNTNDFNPGLDGIFEENNSYYLLAYRMPAKNAAGSSHRIQVKVNRPGVIVRTRSGYEVEAKTPSAHKEPATSSLAKATAGPVAASDLPLQVALAPVAVPGRAEAAVTIALGLRQPAVAERTPQTIDLQTSIFTPDGRGVGAPQRQTARFTLVPAAGDVLRYEVLTQVALPPGRYELRVAAHRATDDLSGSVYADVEVPDFARAPLSLSGVWLDASPGASALPRDAFAALLPLVPTSSREFAASDQVAAFFRVYQGGNTPLAPVSLTARVVNDHDVAIANETGTIGAERFDSGTRAADHRFVLPLRALPAGRYLLSFTLTLDKATADRDVVFTVR